MKNFHKVRGKRELLFDDKELYMLGGGAIIICVLIFVLGLMIGQALEQQSVASPLVAETTLPENNLMMEEGRIDEEPMMTEETSSPSAAPAEKKSEQSYYTVLPDKETYVEVEATPVRNSEPEPAPTIAKTDQEEPGQEKVTAPSQQAVVKAETSVTPAEVPMAPSQPQAATGGSALPNVPRDPSDQIEFGRRQPQNARTEASLPDGTIYSVQVASSTSREDSERLVEHYGKFGYQAYVMVADLAEKGVWYRVRVGDLSSRQEADRLKDELLSKIPDLAKKQPYVIKVTE